MNDLEWLVRNVRMWPPTADYLVRVGSEGYTFREHCEGETVGANWFIREQWLARRAELQNKPSWDDHPDAKVIFQSENGTWIKNIESPYVVFDRIGWRNNYKSKNYECCWVEICKGEVLGDWRDTLERRPQAAKPEPPIDDWHKSGELPPVGTRCVFSNSDEDYIGRPCPRNGTTVTVVNHHRFCDDWTTVAVYAWVDIDEDGEENGFVSTGTAKSFRPLPTERERIVSELVEVVMSVPARDSETTSEHYMRVALAVYDHLHK